MTKTLVLSIGDRDIAVEVDVEALTKEQLAEAKALGLKGQVYVGFKNPQLWAKDEIERAEKAVDFMNGLKAARQS